MSNCQPLNAFFNANDILTKLYPGPYILVPAPGVNKIVAPVGNVKAFYGTGSVAFGGDPQLLLGYVNGAQGAYSNVAVGMNSSISKCRIIPPLGGYGDLSIFANQPLVLVLGDGSAAYAPILTWSLSNAGTGYTAGDDLTTTNGSTVHVITVNGSGVILTSALTVNNPEPVGIQALSGGSGSDAAISILTIGPQGNGNLFLQLNYEIITVPYPCV